MTTDKDQNMWAMICHLSALAGLIGIPFGNILGPLIIWLIKKDEMPSIDAHGREALNFQLSMTIYGVIAGVLVLVFIGVLLLAVLVVVNLVFVIIAGIKANEGELYRYPMTIQFFK
ncbi:MAG: DUF4870 domain-containing protein [Verrucomicrobiota bacterium]